MPFKAAFLREHLATFVACIKLFFSVTRFMLFQFVFVDKLFATFDTFVHLLRIVNHLMQPKTSSCNLLAALVTRRYIWRVSMLARLVKFETSFTDKLFITNLAY